MNVLILGHSGVVGSALVPILSKRSKIFLVSRSNSSFADKGFDFSRIEDVKEASVTMNHEIDVIINLAGCKDIKWCERNPNECYAANVHVVENLLSTFPESYFIQLSTDYVFAGDEGMYSWNSLRFPKSQYGKSKKLAEDILIQKSKRYSIIRAAAIYHESSSFLKFIRDNLESQTRVKAFSNVRFSPTSLEHLKDVVEYCIVNSSEKRIVHVCDQPLSRFDFAVKVSRVLGYDTGYIEPAKVTSDSILYKNLTMIDSGLVQRKTTEQSLKAILS